MNIHADLKTLRRLLAAATAGVLALAGCASVAEPPKAGEARFDWFEYTGNDAALANPPKDAGFRNPILMGFYPDPSITQVGGDYYLVNSTFAYFPGIPVFHSKNLIDWTQIGNVIDRPGMLDFDKLGLSRGVFAPTIEHHKGVFYVLNTCVDCKGNFIVTATNPAGPWSDPIWLPKVGGIDPSIFFDDDGKVYIINNDAPPEPPKYSGHRAIWIREVDPKTFQSIGEAKVLVNGGVRPEENPIWIEGPHIYHIGDWYYLWSAEGGTAVNHSQVVMRSKNVLGPYVAYEGNPVLTHRHLDPNRPDPITSVGHADLVQDAGGNWWASFLGVRPYEGDFYNTGRETFLAPVRWKDGWPIMTEGREEIGYFGPQKPVVAKGAPEPVVRSANGTVREEFNDPKLALDWLFVRVPKEKWWDVRGGSVFITARSDLLGATAQPSMIARRQRHQTASATTSLTFDPSAPGDEAGLTVFQSDDAHYAMGLVERDGARLVRLRLKKSRTEAAAGVELAAMPVDLKPGQALELRIDARKDKYDFAFRPAGSSTWTWLARDRDGKLLSTRTAGGFVGAVFGLYAEKAP